MDHRGLANRAIRELDRCLGWRVSGMTVSGAKRPVFKDVKCGGDPLYLTSAVMVSPVLEALGYGRVTADDVVSGSVPGTVVAVVPMNRPVPDAIPRMMASMRLGNLGRGVATDGFTWVLALSSGRPRVSSVHDIRPVYLAELESMRFKVDGGSEKEVWTRFVYDFSKPKRT